MPNLRKKIVTMVIEIRAAADNDEIAKAVVEHLNSDAFRTGFSQSLSESIGDDFAIEDVATVEVDNGDAF